MHWAVCAAADRVHELAAFLHAYEAHLWDGAGPISDLNGRVAEQASPDLPCPAARVWMCIPCHKVQEQQARGVNDALNVSRVFLFEWAKGRAGDPFILFYRPNYTITI